ncbi:MAG: tetratricopeptide repeat protein [Hyphomicrobiales bacterium]|nr:tetratricopeptide repeat protein [Hyphomicrobiales bacterium]
MSRLVRCIEGHVYDQEIHAACPECGAVPGEPAGSEPLIEGGDDDPAGQVFAKQNGAIAFTPFMLAAVVGGLAAIALVAFWMLSAGPREDAGRQTAAVDKSIARPAAETPPVEADKDRKPEKAEEKPAVAADDNKDGKKTPAAEASTDGGNEEKVPAVTGENAENTTPGTPPQEPDKDAGAALQSEIASKSGPIDGGADTPLPDLENLNAWSGGDKPAEGTPVEDRADDTDGTPPDETTPRDARADAAEPAAAPSPQDGAIAHQRGKAYLNVGKLDRAIAEFDLAVQSAPDDADFYFDRGRAHYQNGTYDNAIADFSECIRLKPDDTEAYLYRGGAFHETGDYDRAIAEFTSALSIEPGNAEAFNGRAWAYYTAGEPDRGLTDADKAIEIVADEANFYDTRGHIFESLGRKDEAIADFRKALELDPSDPSRKEPLQRLGAMP